MQDRSVQVPKFFIRQKELIPYVVPFSPTTLWRKVRSGDFPKPIKLSENITAWWEDVEAWIEAQ